MITRIELTNFMSHEHTVVEPAAGLTVLVGPNNIGKSAVVAAMQILCHNENSTYVTRHGERECSIVVHTDDGHIIEWKRKDAPSYMIDGQVFDRLRGSGLPDELHQALRMGKVDCASGVAFDIHFATQKSPIFLLDGSAANAARFFASSSDAIRLVAMQKRHKEKYADAKRDKARLNEESDRLNAELSVLEPIAALDDRLEVAEQAHEELQQTDKTLEEAGKLLQALHFQTAELSEYAERTAALMPLAPPPVIPSAAPLEQLVQAMKSESTNLHFTASRSMVLAELSLPPQLADEVTLDSLISHLERAQRDLSIAHGQDEALASLEPPPDLPSETELFSVISSLCETSQLIDCWQDECDTTSSAIAPPIPIETKEIEALVANLKQAVGNLNSREKELKTASGDLQSATEELRKAAEGSVCPVCGGLLDPDRVIERAAGRGDHDHE